MWRAFLLQFGVRGDPAFGGASSTFTGKSNMTPTHLFERVRRKPLVLKKTGSKWEVWLDVQAAHAYSKKAERRLKDFPKDAAVPVTRLGKSVKLDLHGKPGKFTKEDARHVAHQIGRYMLDLGDMVFAYTEEVS
jgi:hypothetical protein